MMNAGLLDKREERIRRMFGEIAPRYDALNHLLSLNIDQAWRRETARLLPPEGADPVLDLCTGTGDLAIVYDQTYPDQAPVVGADFCHAMLVRARDKTSRRQRQEQIRYCEADAQRLPFADAQFQLVMIAFGLRNVTDMDRGLAEMVRVTRPGGRVAILEFSRPGHWLLGRCYQWYFRYLLPAIGQWFSRSRDQAYHYLPASVMAFPDGEAMLERLRHHGLGQVWQKPFTFGIATLYVGRKPLHEQGA